MHHFIIKNTAEYRVETIDEVVSFREELQRQAAQDGYSLSAFAYSEKLVKEKGEIVDTYYIVKATFSINDAKDPMIPIFDVVLPYAATKLTGNSVEEESEDDIFE